MGYFEKLGIASGIAPSGIPVWVNCESYCWFCTTWEWKLRTLRKCSLYFWAIQLIKDKTFIIFYSFISDSLECLGITLFRFFFPVVWAANPQLSYTFYLQPSLCPLLLSGKQEFSVFYFFGKMLHTVLCTPQCLPGHQPGSGWARQELQDCTAEIREGPPSKARWMNQVISVSVSTSCFSLTG